MDELTREFLIESQEGLDRMERCLTDLEKTPDDTSLLADIFRSVHTIKGTTGFLGFARLEKLAHSGENLLGLLRDKKIDADAEVITGLLELMDGLRNILSSIESAGDEGEGSDDGLIARLNQLQQPNRNQTSPPSVEPPPFPAAQGEPVPLYETGISVPTASPAAADSVVSGVAQQSSAAAERSSGSVQAVNSAVQASRPASVSAATATESTLRVDVTLLNRMMNLVGELVLTRNQVLQAAASDPAMAPLSRRLDMVTADLRESVMKARMQPVSHVFSKFPRVVRDLAQGLGRRVRLEMEGQETELDKSLLEAIKDPLTHAVRNSLDHGIEPPEDRAANGKNPEGTLRLRAYQEGSNVLIEVSDDGAGIRVEKVRDKALERGLITEERAAAMSERELLQLIFLPGFSTAEAVTKVSGRGVGMDVVRTNVEKIGGKVEIESRPGKGTTMRLRIPLTLAIIPALIVHSREQSFALPQGALSELVHVGRERATTAVEWIENSPVYRLRERLLPLAFLDRVLQQTTSEQVDTDRDLYIAVLEAEGRRFGLVVDGLNDPEEIVVKPLSNVLKQIGLYSGATVLGNGELALILDPGALASRASVGISVEEEHAEVASFIEQKGTEYLLVDAGSRHAAVPLDDVRRIERMPGSRIEHVQGRAVVQLEGELLPVEDIGSVLDDLDCEREITIVVCGQGERHVGIAVSHVLDVAEGEDVAEAGTEYHAQGVALINGKVTELVQLRHIGSLSAGISVDTAHVSEEDLQLSEVFEETAG